MAGAVMADDAGRLAHLVRWCGMALMAAGVLLVIATLLHPSRETATTIIASEPRLVAAHIVYTLAWLLVLLGLPGLYAAQRGGQRQQHQYHIHVENLDRAMQWFRTDTFKEATKRATVVGRDFYLAEKQQPRPQA
jgi:hypothetical protein